MKTGDAIAPTPYNPSPEPERREQNSHRRSLVRGAALVSLGFFMLVIFGIVTAVVVLLHPLVFDVPITLELQEVNYGPFSWLMEAVSYPGYAPQNIILPLIVIVGVAVLFKRVAEAAFLGLVSALSGAAELVKIVVHRDRPSADVVHVIGHPLTYSFPSGHVTQYMLFFGFAFYLVFTLMRHGIVRTLLLLFCGAMILLVGPSRIWLGQHWFSDVLGGYTLGSALLMAAIWAYRKWEEHRLGAQPHASTQ